MDALAGIGVDPSEDARILGRLVELIAHARGAEELLQRLARAGQIRPTGSLCTLPGAPSVRSTKSASASMKRGSAPRAVARR